MRFSPRLIVRGVALFVLVVLVAGFAAPYIDAGAFRARVQVALESALGRPVHIGDVHYSLFTGPGFQVDNVLIDDEPRAGIEPFVHVASLKASIRLASLFGGKLAFSTLRLDEPTVNLVRPDSDVWNIQPLVAHMLAGPGPHESVPDIEVRSGRLNFKFGDTKSVFYISDADVDVYPRSTGELIVKFEGAPARTDRGARVFGILSGQGAVRMGSGSENQIAMTLDMERTSITELGHLLGLPDSGVHGTVMARAHLSGAVTHPSVTGDLTIEDVHRWDLTTPANGEAWTVAWRGEVDLRNQRIEMETEAPPNQTAPVGVKVTGSDYLSAPKWEVEATLNGLPAASLLGTARHMGLPLPEAVTVQGTVNGALNYSAQQGLTGQLGLADASITVPTAGSARMEHAQAVVSGGQIAFGPATVTLDDGQSADVSATWDSVAPAVKVGVESRGVGIARLRDAAAALLGNGSVPLLDAATGGVMRGQLQYEQKGDEPGTWSGQYTVQNTQFDVDGLAAPLRVISASIATGADALAVTKLRGRVGKIEFDADYRSAGAARPSAPAHLRLAIGEANLGELQRVLMPSLRQPESLLTRLRLQRAVAPDWLKERNIDGTVQVKSLALGDTVLGSVGGGLRWSGTSVTLHDLTWALGTATGTGEVTVALGGPDPKYHLSGRLEDIDWRDGGLDVEGTLDASGVGLDLLANARMEGTFTARDATLAPDVTFDEISGNYHFTAAAVPRLTLEKVQARQERDTLIGQGFSQADGRIALDLTSGRRQIRYIAAGLALASATAEPR
jgi:hypothetical protein